jgi:hypothetical protein
MPVTWTVFAFTVLFHFTVSDACGHRFESFMTDLKLSFFPGLGFRPSPPVDNVESTLIWYRGTDRKQYQHWTNSLEKFLEGKHTLCYNFFPLIGL